MPPSFCLFHFFFFLVLFSLTGAKFCIADSNSTEVILMNFTVTVNRTEFSEWNGDLC